MKEPIHLRERDGDVHCPLCRVLLVSEVDPTQACSGCRVEYHVVCLSELGGCGTLGCVKPGIGNAFDDQALEEERQRLARYHEDNLAAWRAEFDEAWTPARINWVWVPILVGAPLLCLVGYLAQVSPAAGGIAALVAVGATAVWWVRRPRRPPRRRPDGRQGLYERHPVAVLLALFVLAGLIFGALPMWLLFLLVKNGG